MVWADMIFLANRLTPRSPVVCLAPPPPVCCVVLCCACMCVFVVAQVYQVIHEGVIKAAKRTNLARLGVGSKDVNRVFGRFVKELYILSQMHSERCVVVIFIYAAVGSIDGATLLFREPDAQRGGRCVADVFIFGAV